MGLFRRAATLFGVLAMVFIGTAPNAGADPADNASELLDSPTMSLTDLGQNSTLSFYGNSGAATVVFPVPDGLVPTSLNMTVSFPFAIRSGTLSVFQGERVIAKLGLPLADQTPLVIPLAGVEVVDNAVNLTMKLAAMPDDQYCLDWYNPVEFINSSVTFAGVEVPPATIADFLPSILRKVTIAIPSSPSRAESDTAVQLATSLTSRYRKQAPQISIVPLPDGATAIDAPSVPLERQIVVKEGPDAGLSLISSPGVPELLVTGSPDNIEAQARFLTDGSIRLAVSGKAVAGAMHAKPPLPGDVTTLKALGQPNLSSVGVSPQVSIELDQTKFGHSTQGYRLHLMGSFTPIPRDLGAQITASVDGQTIARWPAEGSGVIDRWVDIPDGLIDRYTNLMVGVDTAGDTGACNDYRPINLVIGGNTVVLSTPSLPPIPGGFRAVPQTLMPEVQVGIGQNSLADTVRAAQITVGMQRLSAVPLTVKVTSVSQAMSSRNSAIIISSDGWSDKSITLPVSENDRTITVQGLTPDSQPETLTLDPGAKFGSLQVVFDSQRTLLVATSTGAPNLIDDLLRWMDSDPRRWSQLNGNAIIEFPGRTPTSVTGRMPAVVAGPALNAKQAEAGEYQASSAWLAAGAVIAAAAVGVAVIVIGARRSVTVGHPAGRRRLRRRSKGD
ncbi:MAG: hypothetical protein U0R81_02540 [Mycobacterium sp.]